MPSMRWSQWMVDGTAVVGRPDEMNCSTAICAVASCMATRSAPHANSHGDVSSHCPACRSMASSCVLHSNCTLDARLKCRDQHASLYVGYLDAI